MEETAERLGTSVRFVRRLVFERRIASVKLGRHVRITARDLDAFITADRVAWTDPAAGDDLQSVAGGVVGERGRPAPLDGGPR